MSYLYLHLPPPRFIDKSRRRINQSGTVFSNISNSIDCKIVAKSIVEYIIINVIVNFKLIRCDMVERKVLLVPFVILFDFLLGLSGLRMTWLK